MAFSGGLMYRPTTSRTFSTKYGSVESLKVSDEVRLEAEGPPDPRDGRLGQPADLAIDRVDQWVSAFAASLQRLGDDPLNMLVGDRPGTPGPRLVTEPLEPRSRNRDRHLPTVVRDMRSSAATALTGAPSAQASTMRDRSASACAVFRRRAHASRTCRSSKDSTTGSSFGLAMSRAY